MMSYDLTVISATFFFFLLAVLSKDFDLCLQSGHMTIAVGFFPTIHRSEEQYHVVSKVIYNWFIPVDMNSDVETYGVSQFFLSEKEENMGRGKENGCRKK